MKDCYMICTTGVNMNKPVYLPCIPDEIQEQISATWQDQSITGRSSPITSYGGTSFRDISFSFDLHEDLCEDRNYNDLDSIIKQLRCSLYPDYAGSGVGPNYRIPIVLLRFKKFVCRGVLTSLSITWKKPISVDGKYKLCTVSVSIKNIPSVYPSAQLLSNNRFVPFETDINSVSKR